MRYTRILVQKADSVYGFDGFVFNADIGEFSLFIKDTEDDAGI